MIAVEAPSRCRCRSYVRSARAGSGSTLVLLQGSRTPALAPPPDDAEVVGLGEPFQIEDVDGTYRIERLTGHAEALVINRVE